MIESSLVQLLRVAHQERLDVAPLISTFATEHRGFTRYQIWRFAKRIVGGKSLIESLEQSPGLFSDEKLLQLRLALHSGTIGEYWEALAESDDEPTLDARLQLKNVVFAEAINSIVVLALSSFIVLLIVPTLVGHFLELYLL